VNTLAMTDLPTDDLKQLLRHVHRGELPCPITADTLACVGLQFRGEPILSSLRGLDEPAVRAVLICVLAERKAAEETQKRKLPTHRHPNVVNDQQVEETELIRDGAVSLRRRKLAAAAGGGRLGVSLVDLQPRHRSWPHHAHTANEEALYILEGRPTLRIGDERVPLEPGDYVALPPGTAHQLIGHDEVTRYLCVSTMTAPDVVRYPDSDKIGVMVGDALTAYFHEEHAVDYWAGES
jgi:uncharacterized cupin superfamily protein